MGAPQSRTRIATERGQADRTGGGRSAGVGSARPAGTRRPVRPDRPLIARPDPAGAPQNPRSARPVAAYAPARGSRPGHDVGAPLAAAAPAPGNTATARRWQGPAASTATLVVAIVFGEAVIVALTGLGRFLAGGATPLAWALATVCNAVLGYLLLGLPQIRAWESGAADADTLDAGALGADPRSRLAARGLSKGGLAAFVGASVLGGPPAVGWYYGRRRDPRARSLTWTAAWLLAAVWSAVYLGVLAAIA